MARVCIVCQKETEGGYPVEDDAVIAAIRRIKQALHVAKNNELVVMEECMAEHKKKRETYEKRLVTHMVVAGIVLVAFVIFPILSSGFSLTAVLLGLLLAAFVMGLSVFNHWPKVSDSPIRREEKAARKQGKKYGRAKKK